MRTHKKTPAVKQVFCSNHTRPFAHLSQEELIDILDNHDCHLGPEDGCDCLLIKDELTIRVIGEKAFNESREVQIL